MSWGLDVLGLDRQADARAIKRAYAERLRVTRPEDDPAAFQHLHQAYQAALAWLQQPEPAPDAHALPDRQPQPTTLQQPPAADEAPAAVRTPDALLDDLLAAMHQAIDTASSAWLRTWLPAQPEFWSLQAKPQIGRALLGALHQRSPPLHQDVFAHLVMWFAWDDVNDGVDVLDLQRIGHRCMQAWLMSLGRRYLAGEVATLQGTFTQPAVAEVLQRLQRPRSRLRNILQALPWSRPDTIVFTLVALGYWPDRETPPGLSDTQVRFWARFGMADDPLRFRMGSLRAWLVGLLSGAICLCGVINSWPLAASEGGMPGAAVAAWVLGIGTLLIPVCWYLLAGCRALVAWQNRPATQHDWRRLAVIPLLCLAVAVALLGLRHDSVPAIAEILGARLLVIALLVLAMSGLQAQRERLGLPKETRIDGFSAMPGLVVPWLGLPVALGYWLWTLLLRRRQ